MASAPTPHVKCPIFSVKPDEDAESNPGDSQGIVEEEKCARFCLSLAGDACLWYEFTHL